MSSPPRLRDLPAAFWQVLVNNLLATVTNFTVFTALSFFTFLQTHSVFATGLIVLSDIANDGADLGTQLLADRS